MSSSSPKRAARSGQLVSDPSEPRPLRRLYIDIEVSPNILMSWRTGYKLNIDYDSIIKERAIICICWSWDDDSKVYSLTWDKSQNDKEMLRQFLPILASADEVVGHNVDKFDLPWIKSRALFHGLVTVPDVKTVDTLQWARRKFYFNSNRLDYIAGFLGLGRKLKTGFQLWKDIVLDRCPKALASMTTYCGQDVILLKKVFARLAEVMPHKSHIGVLAGGERWTCPRTGSDKVKVSKTRVTAAGTKQYQFQNTETGSYYTVSEVAYRAYLKAKDRQGRPVAAR